MNEILHCPVCDFDYAHILGTIEVADDDAGKTKKVIVNHQHAITVQIPYQYRSQGNSHILFRCESGHFFIKSFDGHKGNIYVDRNSLMDGLSTYLNKVYDEPEKASFTFDFELLGNIEKFFKIKESETHAL